MYWYLEVLKKYAVFSGRARRMEYWMFVLFNFIICVAFGIFVGAIGSAAPGIARGLSVLAGIYGLAIMIPFVAVQVRRLHDTNRSGWWLLIGAVPLIGEFILLLFLVQEGDPGANQYGVDPKEAAANARTTSVIRKKINSAARQSFRLRGLSLVNNYQGRGINVGFGRGSVISNDDIPTLVPLGLHELYLSRTGIGDESTANLGAMGQLRVLDVSSTNVSRDGIRQLKESLPHAKIIG